jgi:ABC-type antimicrobial peptide transport system ATPase subunit
MVLSHPGHIGAASKALELLDLVGIRSRARPAVRGFPAECASVMIAMAIANDPEVPHRRQPTTFSTSPCRRRSST